MTTRTRVLLLTTELRPGGAERIVYDLARSLDRSRYTPVVAALDGRGEYAERIRAVGTEVFDLAAYSVFDLPVIWRLRRLLREQRINLLHTHLIHASIVGRLAARPLRIPVLATSHIVDRRAVGWHFTLDRLTARWCCREVCVSAAVREFQQAKKKLPSAYFRVIHNGLDLTRFETLPPRDEIRARLGLPADTKKIIIGALGRFDRQKGFDVLLDALAMPSLREANWRCVIAGYGAAEAALKRQAETLGLTERVIFAGYQSRAEIFLPALDIAIVPSRWEGFGLVVVEAMACGAAVIASEVDSIPEIISPEKDGLLVEPEDAAALAEAIARLLCEPDLRRMLTAQARESSRRFSLSRMTKAYEDVYAEIIGASVFRRVT